MYNTKNYTEQGGEISRFGGNVIFEEGCQIEGLPQMANLPSDSSVADIISAMKEAGLMYSAEWSIDASLAPTPTEDVLVRNKAKVESVSFDDGTVTVVVDPDELEESASSDPSQGAHKWLALEISTGVDSITEVGYNGYALTEQDIADATATGCSNGSFVLYIKAEEVITNAKSFRLSASEHYEIPISVIIRKPADWTKVLTFSSWHKRDGQSTDPVVGTLINNFTSFIAYSPNDGDWSVAFLTAESVSFGMFAQITGADGIIDGSPFVLGLHFSESGNDYLMTVTDSQGSVMTFVKDSPNRDAEYFTIDAQGVIEKKNDVVLPSSLMIPEQIDGIDVVAVGNCQNETNLWAVTIPEGIRIKEFAFNGCTNLRNVIFYGANAIEMAAFQGCSGIDQVFMFETGYSMAPSSFDNIDAIFSYGGINYRGYSALYISLYNNQANRDASYFNANSEGVISKKSGVVFPENLLVPLVVNGTKVTSVSSCGQDSSLESLVVPEGVNLEAQAFSGSSNLETVEFKGGNNVGDNAFATCPSLERVEFEGTGNNMSLIAMDANCSATVVFDGIQYSTFESFKYGQLGHEYEQYFEFEEGTTIWLKEDVTLPATLVTPNTLDGIKVTRVGLCEQSPNLETLVVNEGLRVNPGAFSYCIALKSVLFLGGNKLDDAAFIYDSAIERVEFKGAGHDISEVAFDDNLYATFLYEGRVFDTNWSFINYIKGKEYEQYFDIDARGVVSKKSEATFTSDDLIIPVSVNGVDVTGIDVIGPLSVVYYLGIPKGVSVEDGAFANSTDLRHVVFGGDNTIGAGAFSGCNFNNVEFFGEIAELSATSFDALPTTTFKYKGTNYTGFAALYDAWQSEQSQ